MSRLCCVLVGISAVAAVASTAWTAESAEQAVRDVLRDEASGAMVDRAAALQDVLVSGTDCPQARWQSGQVLHGGQWLAYSELPSLPTDEALPQYVTLRQQTADTFSGHTRLADFCRRHGLRQREKAHLTAALSHSDNPNDPALRARLGQQWRNGTWVTADEIAEFDNTTRQALHDLKTWQPKIALWSRQLDSSRRSISRKAHDELLKITDPAALPALEAVLGDGDLVQSRLLVEILTGIPSHRAADVLARLAVLSPWNVVRDEAARAPVYAVYGAVAQKHGTWSATKPPARCGNAPSKLTLPNCLPACKPRCNSRRRCLSRRAAYSCRNG